jgi:hypothetical protein
MKIVAQFYGLLFSLIGISIMTYYGGDLLSRPMNLFTFVGCFLLYPAVMILFILQIKQFILTIKNNKQ